MSELCDFCTFLFARLENVGVCLFSVCVKRWQLYGILILLKADVKEKYK